MVRQTIHYNNIDVKETVNVDVSDRTTYPDGKYNVRATFNENEYYYQSTKLLSGANGEDLSTMNTKILYSLDNIEYDEIDENTIEGKYYDDTVLYLMLMKTTDESFDKSYNLNVKVYTKSNNQLVKDYGNLTGNSNNPVIISDLYLLEVNEYKIKIEFASPSDSRISGCIETLYYKQNKNSVSFYNFRKQGNSGVYSDSSNATINTYIDQIDTVRQQLRTTYGNRSIPNNIEVEIKEGSQVIQTVTTFEDISADSSTIGDTNGCIMFNPEFSIGSPTQITIPSSNSIPMIEDNKEYIIQFTTNSYEITIGSYINITISGTNQTITIDKNSSNGDKLVFNKNISITQNHKLYITKHGEIFRIMVVSGNTIDDNILLSIPKSFINGAITFTNRPSSVKRYNLNELTSENLLYTAQYNFNIKNSNFISDNNYLEVNKKELEYDDNYTYLVDDYHSDKVINYFSTIMLDYNSSTNLNSIIEYGYSVNNNQLNEKSFKIKNVLPNAELDTDYYIKFYIKKEHSCMYMIQITRKIFPIDWKVITTNQGILSHPNINITITDSSNNEIEDKIEPNDTFNIICNTGLRNKSVKIYKSTSPNTKGTLLYSGTTGEDGKFIKNNITDSEEGVFYYSAESIEPNGETFSSDVSAPLTIFYTDTTISFNSFTKSIYNLEESITLTTIAKRDANGTLYNLPAGMTVKYYIISDSIHYEIGTRTTNSNGQSSLTYNLSNLKINEYSLTDIKFKATLEAYDIYPSASAYSNEINVNKTHYITTLESTTDTTVWGANITLTANLRNSNNDSYPSNVKVNFYDYDDVLLGSVSTDNYGNASKTITLPGFNENKKPGTYSYTVLAEADDYSTTNQVSKTITTTKRNVIINPVANHAKQKVNMITGGYNELNVMYYNWEQRFKILDGDGDGLLGTNKVKINAVGVDYERPITNNKAGLKIRLGITEGRDGHIMNYYISCTYDGNDWYNSSNNSKTINYKLNDAVYAYPSTITQDDSSNVSWESSYLVPYNILNNNNYLLSGELSDGQKPKGLTLGGWNEGTDTSINSPIHHFMYESEILKMRFIVYDVPYKSNSNKNFPQINLIDTIFNPANINLKLSNVDRYPNIDAFNRIDTRVNLFWENREKDSDGRYIYLDGNLNGEPYTRIIENEEGVTLNDFNPTNLPQHVLLDESFKIKLNYGSVDNQNALGRQMVNQIFFVVAFIPKQIDINLDG